MGKAFARSAPCPLLHSWEIFLAFQQFYKNSEFLMWDQRYSRKDYAYGTNANDFLVSAGDQLPTGKILCLAEGEGRNAVWLAEHGNEVTAVDSSEIGLKKANQLARDHGVNITTVHADLTNYDMGVQQWDAIISIFCHLSPGLRKDVHRRCVNGLREGGVFLLEAYTPLQLQFKTGGPTTSDMMMNVQSLSSELMGLSFFTCKSVYERFMKVNFITVQALWCKY